MTAPDDTQHPMQTRPIAPDPSSPEAQPVPAPAEQAISEPGTEPGAETVRDRIVQMLTTIYDPEIPVNIYEMGLIYDLDVNADGDVAIKMTLTAPTCPVAESLPPEVEAKVGSVEGVRSVKVELTWEPPWTPEKMSEAAKLELGYL